MVLNRNYIKRLQIPFSEVMPHGAYKEIRETFRQQRGTCSEHTPKLVLAGGWSDPEMVEMALQLVRKHRDYLDRFLRQFPQEATTESARAALSAAS